MSVEVGQIWCAKGYSFSSYKQYDNPYDASHYLKIKSNSEGRDDAWFVERSEGIGKDFNELTDHVVLTSTLERNYSLMENPDEYSNPPAVKKATGKLKSVPNELIIIVVAIFAFALIFAMGMSLGKKEGVKTGHQQAMQFMGYTPGENSCVFYKEGERVVLKNGQFAKVGH